MKTISSLTLYCLFFLVFAANAQERLYTQTFPLRDVVLREGPFRHARDLNIRVLLEYDVDRLLAGYRKEAELPSKASSFPNWEGLDGHVAGHYLSALAMNAAATGNADCKARLEYMITELQECQNANTQKHGSWGKGYVGAVPNSDAIWSSLKKGDFGPYRAAWVPWYNVHKMYAGLRDAWSYMGNEDARKIFLAFCDWALDVTSALSDEQMEKMLDTEHGGMNEILADAFQMTGDQKYLTGAKRFSHRMLLDAMASGRDNLDNKHANTQVPKAVGFQRIGMVAKDDRYLKAGNFFWETVTTNRTLAFGGNSRREFFPAVSSCTDFIDDVEGPETCNSYNMLRLTEGLFDVHPSAEYMDYYERTLYNHILSTQHPQHGGYVYFTPTRPRHYRVYSSPNKGMWCCVGSGMENHSKHNQRIYTHHHDSLFVNLFVASELNWRDKGVKILQETAFPDEEKTQLKITGRTATFVMMIRRPGWVTDGFEILVNGKPVQYKVQSSSYVAINRKWKTGDRVEVKLPMKNSLVSLPNVPTYMAFMHGPIVMASKSGDDDLKGLVAGDGRWEHIASGERLPVDQAPVIVDNEPGKITDKLTAVEGKPLQYTVPATSVINASGIVLEPFFRIHDARYTMYWLTLNKGQYKAYLDSLAAVEKEKVELLNRTVDVVIPGEQQPEADHAMETNNSRTGNHLNQFWRDAVGDGYFSYSLSTGDESELSLIVRYWGAEWGSRKFEIYIDDEKLISEDNTGRWNLSRFIDITYDIPPAMLRGKKQVRVKFQSIPQNTAGAVYHVRLVKKK